MTAITVLLATSSNLRVLFRYPRNYHQHWRIYLLKSTDLRSLSSRVTDLTVDGSALIHSHCPLVEGFINFLCSDRKQVALVPGYLQLWQVSQTYRQYWRRWVSNQLLAFGSHCPISDLSLDSGTSINWPATVPTSDAASSSTAAASAAVPCQSAAPSSSGAATVSYAVSANSTPCATTQRLWHD